MDKNEIMKTAVEDFKSAIEALGLASSAVCAFYDRLRKCQEALRGNLGEVVEAFETDSTTKDRKHEEQKQKLDCVVSDAENRLVEAQKALSVAFVSEDDSQVKAAKQALSDAQIDLDQARAARAVFDDAVGVQYDADLYEQIFSTEVELLNTWEKIASFKAQVDEDTSSAIKAIEKAKDAAKYTSFDGLKNSKREAIKRRFNHAAAE